MNEVQYTDVPNKKETHSQLANCCKNREIHIDKNTVEMINTIIEEETSMA